MTGCKTNYADAESLSVRGDTAYWQQFVSRTIRAWKNGETADARALMDANPEISRFPSAVLDLAYEEFCIRKDNGESISPDDYCTNFPEHCSELRRQLELHLLIDERPELLEGLGTDWPKTGHELLGYQVEEEIGRGTFARVYLAHETALGNRRVVIKVAKQGSDEAHTLGRLQHKNIVPIHSVKQDELRDLTVICMPDFGRATLNDLLSQASRDRSTGRLTALDVRSAVRAANAGRACSEFSETFDKRLSVSVTDAILVIFSQLAEALDHAHSKGILHLDLKPSNVLITPNGVPMLLDFNLAFDKQKDGHRFGGTLPYMSPEQLSAMLSCSPSGSTLDQRSDIFSLGVIIYEMLYGRMPFIGSCLAEGISPTVGMALLELQSVGPSFQRTYNGTDCRQLADIVKKCLAFSPDDRFASSRELSDRLLSVLERRRKQSSIYSPRLWSTLAVIGSVVAFSSATLAHRPITAHKADSGVVSETADELARSAVQHAREENYTMAVMCLYKSVKLQEDRKRMAQLAYYCTLAGQDTDAIYWYETALTFGYADPAVYNNLGVCYWRLGRFDLARRRLSTAVNLREDYLKALHNLALVEFDLAGRSKTYPTDAMRSVDHALKCKGRSSRLLKDAASVYFYASSFDPSLEAQAVELLDQAIRAGENVDEIRANPTLSAFLKKIVDTIPRESRDSREYTVRDFLDSTE